MSSLSDSINCLVKAIQIMDNYSHKSELNKDCKKIVSTLKNTVNRIHLIRMKEEELSYENKYTGKQLQKYFDEGYVIQRKFKRNKRGWGTLRSRPTFDNNELAYYVYRVMVRCSPVVKAKYEEIHS